MSFKFIIIGDIPSQDLILLEHIALIRDITIEICHELESLDTSSKDEFIGYISYLQTTNESLLELFSHMPIGVTDFNPFFQLVNENTTYDVLSKFPISNVFTSPLNQQSLFTIVNTSLYYQRFTQQYHGIISEVLKYRKQKQQLVTLSTALSSHLSLDDLLMLILRKTCDIVKADAGSIYVRDRQGPGKPLMDTMHIKVSLNDSVSFAVDSNMAIRIDDSSIAGYVAKTSKSLNIKDVYKLNDSSPYKFRIDINEKNRYRIKSMLTIPLKNMEGDVVGVLQFINKKKNAELQLLSDEIVAKNVSEFSYTDEEFLHSIAALAAVSIERAQLLDEREQLFEGFIGASIASIDERDRTTSGHSMRVMEYAMAFVDAINEKGGTIFEGIQFSSQRRKQFKFAAMLHDIGKIGVPEHLLTKESKLSESDFKVIVFRAEYIRMHLLAKKHLAQQRCDWQTEDELLSDIEFLFKVNKTGTLADQDMHRLDQIKNKCYTDFCGDVTSIVSKSDIEALSVVRGNLTPQERSVVNSHALASLRILSEIPWTSELEHVPYIAAHHHEMLDGSGYPDGLTKDQLSIETRILTVVDIFDALVAQDRPYKRAIPHERAIEILRAEARIGKIDSDVVEFFIEHGIYRLFQKKNEQPSTQHLQTQKDQIITELSC